MFSFVFDDQHTIFVFCMFIIVNLILSIVVYLSLSWNKLSLKYKFLIFALNVLSTIFAVAIYDKYYFFKVLLSLILTSLSIYIFFKLEAYTDNK